MKKSKFPPKRPDNSHIVKKRVVHEWSNYQKAVFKDIHYGEGNLMVVARAGSAKTSTLVEGARYVPKNKKALFCAFNKSIQEELRNKLPERIECSTLHSLGYRAIRHRFGNDVEINNYKCQNIVTDMVDNPKENSDLIENICLTVHFCKANLVDVPSKIEDLIIEYGIDLCEVDVKEFVKYVCLALRQCKEKTTEIDFNDMIYFPFVYRLSMASYDMVFIDEAQDMSKAMIELALSACKKGGRIIAVLDNRQAIYSFMGADARVYKNLQDRLNPKELMLPICYRCPKSVVKLAQQIVPDIVPFDKSIEGEILSVNLNSLMSLAKPGCYVLSRYNAPMIKWCMKFLKNQIPANILGRDIGDGLAYLIKKSKKKTVKDLLTWLVKWEKEEKEKFLIKRPNGNTEVISDKAECIKILCEDAKTLEEVKNNIKEMFQENDERKIVLFSSIHRSKGKEQNDVFVLYDTLQYSSEEEDNIRYVAFTRAKKRLFLVKKVIEDWEENPPAP
jgi:DNA helicase II / ATP-dependent DNA helicase PcrA